MKQDIIFVIGILFITILLSGCLGIPMEKTRKVTIQIQDRIDHDWTGCDGYCTVLTSNGEAFPAATHNVCILLQKNKTFKVTLGDLGYSHSGYCSGMEYIKNIESVYP